jgi:hypothetical protein
MSEHIKVLVVDDEENSTNLIRKVLLKKGLDVRVKITVLLPKNLSKIISMIL